MTSPQNALAPGTRLGPYEIGELLGRGGMGEVYRALDPRVDREVAIKVLPAELAADEQRLARFEREAKALAALSHANVATLFGFEQAGDVRFLVMELAGGETLEQRIARGPLPIDEVVALFAQIADGLRCAHDHGIVHRDLKPANLKIDAEGQVKILDFGLAKALDTTGAAREEGSLSDSPTLTLGATQAGVLLGTAAYMSPEQARGRPVDLRADTWAYGCCLFEAVTGKRLFGGNDAPEILAAVLRDEIDLTELPSSTPRGVRWVLGRCLERDATRRLRDLGEAQVALGNTNDRGDTAGSDANELASATAVERARRSARRSWLVAAVLAAATAWLALDLARRQDQSESTKASPLHLEVELGLPFVRSVPKLSPDGTRLAIQPPGTGEILVRFMDRGETVTLEGTGVVSRGLFFSPDGRWLGLFLDDQLVKSNLSGGLPIALRDEPCEFCLASWSDAGWILVVAQNVYSTIALENKNESTPKQMARIPEHGGELELLPSPSEDRHLYINAVEVLPGSRMALLEVSTTGGERSRASSSIVAHDLETGRRTELVKRGSRPHYLTSGFLVWSSSRTLYAARFSPEEPRLLSTPLAVHELHDLGSAVTLSRNGHLLVSRSQSRLGLGEISWYADSETPVGGQLAELGLWIRDVQLSHDDRLASMTSYTPGPDIYVVNLDRGSVFRITSDPGEDEGPVFSPDGTEVLWATTRPGALRTFYRRRSDASGPEREAFSIDGHGHAHSWSPDGTIVFTKGGGDNGWDIWTFDLEQGPAGEAQLLLGEPFDEYMPRLSKDGRLLAYVSTENGMPEVFVRTFPDLEHKENVSAGLGHQPVWAVEHGSDRNLLYYRGEHSLMRIEIGQEGELVSSAEEVAPDRFGGLVPTGDHTYYAVDSRGRVLASSHPGGAVSLSMIVNWGNSLDDLVPESQSR